MAADDTMQVCFEYSGLPFKLRCRRSRDVWGAIEEYDLEHGTDFFERLSEDSIRGIDLYSYEGVLQVDSWADVEDVIGPSSVVVTKEVKLSGTSLVLNITKEARLMNIDRGDVVEVTIRRIE